jgi:hypothetical protein
MTDNADKKTANEVIAQMLSDAYDRNPVALDANSTAQLVRFTRNDAIFSAVSGRFEYVRRQLCMLKISKDDAVTIRDAIMLLS